MSTYRDLVDTVLDDARKHVDSDRDDAEKAVNDAYLRVCTLTRIAKTSAPLTLVAGQDDYDLVTDFGITNLVAAESLFYTGANAVNTPDVPIVSERALRGLRGRFGAPFQPRQNAASITGTTLRFYPTVSAGDTAVLLYAYRPDPMTSDDDEPDALPAEYHPVIEDGALERLVRRKAGPNAADAYYARFLRGVGEIREYLAAQQASTPGYIAVGYPGRASWPMRNDFH